MNNTEIIHAYVKKEHGASLDDIAKNSGLSRDYIVGIIVGIDAEKDAKHTNYKIKDKFVTLNGLGSKLCIICGETPDYHSPSISIPEKMLAGKKLDETLVKGIKGHEKCYATIDLIFREHNMLTCYDCDSFQGEWIDGDEVKETCYKLNYSESGHKGVIASNPMCNHFSPDDDLETNLEFKKHKEFWDNIQPSIESRTQQGYQNLIAILEKAKLLK